jgi:GntR family transcriptional regulator/MocR family aminotransferase
MGAATRVSATLPDRSLRAPALPVRAEGSVYSVGPGKLAQRLVAIPRARHVVGRPPRAFRCAVPAVDIFPVDTWGRLLSSRWRKTSAGALAYGDPFGFLPLREAIASYLASARGVHTTPQQIMIVNGSQEGLDLTCRVVLDAGDDVWLEDPGYFGARGAFTAANANVIAVPVDAEGLVVKKGIQAAPDARLAFVTPARQLPLGVTLSLGRRLELLEWARASRAWIYEDDYDSEFRYTGRPLAALHGLDPHGCVIYAGTFSKVTFPSLRLGYVVVPESLVDAFGAMRYYLNYTSPYLEQAVLTDFITHGHFERHIRRMRAVYQERQDLFVNQVHHVLQGRMSTAPSDSGMTLIGWLPAGMRDTALARAAHKQDVDVLPLSSFSTRAIAPGLVMGYAGVCDRDIREGVARLALAFDDRETLAEVH